MFVLDNIIQKLFSLKHPSQRINLREDEIRILCLKTREHLLSRPMLLKISAPIKICGDIHGQYYDLHRIFKLGGYPPDSKYLFLVDIATYLRISRTLQEDRSL